MMPAPSLRVLVIEEDDILREAHVRLLARGRERWRVRGVSTLESGLAIHGGEACQVFLLHLAGGVEALFRLRQEAPGATVVALTAELDEGGREEALAAGAQECLLLEEATGRGLQGAVRRAWARRQAQAPQDRMEKELAEARRMGVPRPMAGGVVHDINTSIQTVGDNARFLHQAFEDLQLILARQRALLAAVDLQNVPEGLLREVPKALTDPVLDYLVAEIPRATAETLEGVERIRTSVGTLRTFAIDRRASARSED